MKHLNDELKDFDTLPVSFLLQGKNAPFKFQVPSFQRGYRWEEKHVKDMLNDIFNFVSNSPSQSSYFLQPLVVRRGKEENTWEVLDGQQRLTTMRLILSIFADYLPIGFSYLKDSLYSIGYLQRPTPNFQNPVPSNDLDSFYVMKANKVIKDWVDAKKEDNQMAISAMAYALYYPDNPKKVEFIWYVVTENNNEQMASDLTAIKVFNRLNKGKISLTSSELIKALFYIKFKHSNKLDVDRFSMEWDTMEKQFEKDDFWYFISDRKDDINTRLDVLFDYVANVNYKMASDSLDAYRYFQRIYDEQNSSDGLENSWKEVKRVYDMFLRWYEDVRIYNYVGFLVWMGMLPQDVKNEIYEKNESIDEDNLLYSIQESIKKRIGYHKYCERTERDIDTFEYSTDFSKIRELLLLFNIEAYNKSNLKFPFNLFKKEKWDVEHVDSQKDNNMQELEHKKVWIELVIDQLRYDASDMAQELLQKGHRLLVKFKNEKQDSNDVFKDYYQEVYQFYNANSSTIEKDTIDNLALLNCGINRGYKNAPFPCKRSIIIRNDSEGVFIPLCTRNLFLKYYTGSEQGASQLDIVRWNDTDRKAYKTQLVKTLDKYLEK